MGLLVDAFKAYGGYSALWLMVLYCLGAFAKRGKIFEQKKTLSLIVFWMICVFVTWGARMYLEIECLTNYVSPTILMSGLFMVIIFSRMKLKGNIISKLYPLAFGVYLCHLNYVIWNNYLKDAFSFVVQKNIGIAVVYVFSFATLIFIFCLLVEFLRSKLAKAIKIPLLSKKIVSTIDWLLNKALILLK